MQGSAVKDQGPKESQRKWLLSWASSTGVDEVGRTFLRKMLIMAGDVPGGAVVKTLHSQGGGPRFDPWSGN